MGACEVEQELGQVRRTSCGRDWDEAQHGPWSNSWAASPGL